MCSDNDNEKKEGHSKKANQLKSWDAKPLAYVSTARLEIW